LSLYRHEPGALLALIAGVRLDAMVIRDRYRSLWYDQKWGIEYHEKLWKPATCYKVGAAHDRGTHCGEFVRMLPGWQHERTVDHNHEAAVMKNSSVVLMAANLAWLWGARELYLVGVDYHGGHAKMIEPWGSQSPGWEGQYDKPVPDGIERQFASALQAVESAGGVMVNLSPNTKLRAIPRMDYANSSLASL